MKNLNLINMQPVNVDIFARRWFRESYGNTYFTALVVIQFGDVIEEIILPFQHGYGSDYYFRALATVGLGACCIKSRVITYRGYDVYNEVTDVKRKKDLHI